MKAGPRRTRPAEARLRADLAAVAAAARQGCAGDAAAADGLLQRLTETSPLVREAAARAVARVAEACAAVWPGHRDAVAALLAAIDAAAAGAARTDPGCRVRQEAVIALGRLGAPAAAVEPALRRAVQTVQIEPVGGGLEDTAVTLRANAALVMAQRRCDCLADLGLLLFDGLPDALTHLDAHLAARVAAARALVALGNPAGAALLAVRLREPREAGEVLAACIDGLYGLREPRAAEWIRPLLDAADPTAVIAAATALCALRPDEAVEAIALRAGAADEDLAEALVTALGAARSAQTAPALRRLCGDRRPRVRRAAQEALDALGG